MEFFTIQLETFFLSSSWLLLLGRARPALPLMKSLKRWQQVSLDSRVFQDDQNFDIVASIPLGIPTKLNWGGVGRRSGKRFTGRKLSRSLDHHQSSASSTQLFSFFSLCFRLIKFFPFTLFPPSQSSARVFCDLFRASKLCKKRIFI